MLRLASRAQYHLSMIIKVYCFSALPKAMNHNRSCRNAQCFPSSTICPVRACHLAHLSRHSPISKNLRAYLQIETSRSKKEKREMQQKHTAAGIPTWSPTVVLICRSTAYVWQSGRDAQFSADCGRTWKKK